MKSLERKSEVVLVSDIAKRASRMADELGFPYAVFDAVMDIDSVHLNGNPLDLERLLNADDFNFAHDVFGIRKNINRRTGKLENFFSPRYSA